MVNAVVVTVRRVDPVLTAERESWVEVVAEGVFEGIVVTEGDVEEVSVCADEREGKALRVALCDSIELLE